MRIRAYLHRLAIKLGNNPRLAIMKMVQGGLVFLFGSLMIMVSDNVLSDSLSQEIIAFCGLVVAAAGVLWTLVGYLSMSVLRLYHMMSKKD
ncbi:hypothetical protein ACUM5Y_13185 [Marinomonas dokdonensis]|uniref:hypothetical protein n=1 Tax=Marinomonas dokdonensis TaxID=328224 RepID=UPI00405567F8